MSKCNLEYTSKIISSIGDFLYFKDDKTKENLEAYVKVEVPGLNQEFSLEQYVATSSEFRMLLEKELEDYALTLSDFITDIDSKEVKMKSTISPNFSTYSIDSLFHTLPLAKANFEREMQTSIINNLVIGNKDNIRYTSSNGEVSTNFQNLKNDLFKKIQKFLGLEEQDLYDAKGNVISYSHYKHVIGLLDNHFFKGKYSLITTTSNKKGIPDLAIDINKNADIFEAYNAGILLVNFDSIIKDYFSGIIGINYDLFNNLQSNLDSSDKYIKKIEGIKTEY